MMPQQASSAPVKPRAFENRWVQLAFAILCTFMLSNMQYGWTLFVTPMQNEMHWARAGIQVAFSIMILVNTWLSPVEGWLVDRYGPRPAVMLGGLMAGLSWVMNSRAVSLQTLYVAAAIGGLGVGCVFGTCMGTALKWFPDRRGLAAGLIAAGFGLGAALTVVPVAGTIRASGYRHAFLLFGLIQGLTIFIAGSLLIKPRVPTGAASPVPGGKRIASGILRSQREFTPVETLRTRVFWVIYFVYVMIAYGGLVMTAQLGPMAHDFGISLPLLTLALSLDNFANGITRPVCGFLSDKIGRENTMLLVFSTEAVAYLGMAAFGRQPAAFLVFAALIFFCWGEIFVVFPAIAGDTFGIRNATANNGLLYTAKGTASLAVPLANLLVAATGTWNSVLLAAATSSLLAGMLAKYLVVPMRHKLRAESSVRPAVNEAYAG